MRIAGRYRPSNPITRLRARLLARAEIDAGSVEEIIPHGTRWNDQSSPAIANDLDLADSLQEGDVLGQTSRST